MRYLHSFFPPHPSNKRGGAPHVPFSLDITKGRKEFRWQCHLSEAWEGVYESLDAFTKEDNEDTTVVIRGDLTFFEALASRGRPLGQLNNNEGVSRHNFLLQLFTRELTKILGGEIVFLYGGD